MNYKTNLISLSTMAAIALLLPAQANALPSLEDTDRALFAPTGVEPLPEMGLEDGAEGEGFEGTSDNELPAVLPADLTQSESGAPDPTVHSETLAPDLTPLEAVKPEDRPRADLSDHAPTADPLVADDSPVANSDRDLGDETRAADPLLTEAPLLPLSTSSRDLQLTEATLGNEDLIPMPLGQTPDVAQTISESSQSEKWHFLLVPYIYIPFNISGSATFQGEGFRNDFVGDFTDPSRDFDFTPSQIRTALRNSLNFAFFSGFEAWEPNYKFGVLTNFDYVSLSTDSTVDREVRIPGAANFVPTQINADLTTQLLRADLVGSYRFYDPTRVNPEGVYSEYDLGPFVFDVLGGLSLTQVNNRIGLSTNLGGSGEFGNSRTIVSPLIGGRVRWNANPKLAVVGSGTISGFGISGLMQYGIQGGVDWMFSGNTTLGAGYRFGFLDYNADLVDLNVDQHGPYINIGFRF